MENNLNTAPTEQELINAGFCKAGASNHSNYGKLIKRINDKLFVMFGGKKCSLCFDYGHVDTTIKEIQPTKEAINAEFKHFNQPLPKWEKPKPKVGEVYKSGAFDEEDYNLIIKVYKTGVEYLVLNHAQPAKGGCTYPAFYDDFTKTHDTLDDYYKEKFLKEGVTNMLYEVKEETTETATLEETIKPHQYSYKGLKAEGKIPHDRSGEDHDSIDAFKKLLAICEALNNEFKEDSSNVELCPFWKGLTRLDVILADIHDESPIYFTSEQAFDAFKSAPENIELFKTFLKIK